MDVSFTGEGEVDGQIARDSGSLFRHFPEVISTRDRQQNINETATGSVTQGRGERAMVTSVLHLIDNVE